MITTVTLNAAIDKTYYIDDFQLGKVNRTRTMHSVPGGKGINVAKVALALGAQVTATGFVGGKNGEFIAEEVEKLGIRSDFVRTEGGESRLCLNIISGAEGTSTEILEAGPVISSGELQLMREKIEAAAGQSEIVVMSGSIPKGVPDDFYAELVAIVKKQGRAAFVDTSNVPLLKAIEAKPYFIKPNEDEIKILVKDAQLTEDAVIRGVHMLMDLGIECAAVTLGAAGSIIGYRGSCYRVRTPKVNAVNTVGCGDAFTAAAAVGFERTAPFADVFRQASAAAAANALSEQAGQVSLDMLAKLLPLAAVEPV
ncbi:1-phosphofructokinase family hexose kinase [Paenibacillus thermotolerans]|uniref:1-phosphofructokinase family hexose kinase n=1 Tax=Paenibacillus thermotolerans TaxID=3027807 RepID=UPI002367A839|nr:MULTISPECIES: 1-phosphofructokinase family hexose kinase [unclassified Paenibacillus]